MAHVRTNAEQVSTIQELTQDVLTGKLTRREALLRGAALGLTVPGMMALAAVGGPGAPRAAAAQDDEEPVPGGTLRFGLSADPAELDPHLTSLTAAWHVIEHVYETLVTTNAALEPVPALAEEWDISEDGTVYTFQLRQGVLFHNGREMVAEDVQYSFERIMDPDTGSPNSSDLVGVVDIETPDDYTVVITLDAADASFLAKLMGNSIAVVPQEEVEANGDLQQVMVGTGPFRFEEYIPNTSVSLLKNEDYWDEGLPYLDALELQVAVEPTSRTTALVQGQLDIIEYAPVQDLPIFEADETIEVAGDENTNIRYLALNVAREPFDNLEVRQAISMVIDRGPMIDAAVYGYGTETNVLFPETYWAGMESEIPEPDVEGARALLEQAGYPDGFEIEILSWSQYPFLSNSAIVLQEQLRQIGIEAEVVLEENATYLANYFDGNFDLSVTGTSAYVDPNDVILANFGTDESNNATSYSNEEVDQLIADAVAVTDQEERAAIYQQIQEILLEDMPWINLFIASQYEAYKSYVRGYEHIPTGTNASVKQVWLTEQD